MSDFKVGDRVMILPGIATPFVGMVGTISEIRPHDRGIETMERHIVVFERREKRSFYGVELRRIQKLNRFRTFRDRSISKKKTSHDNHSGKSR